MQKQKRLTMALVYVMKARAAEIQEAVLDIEERPRDREGRCTHDSSEPTALYSDGRLAGSFPT